MPWKRGRSRLPRSANTVLRLVPLHSSRLPSARGACTENVISDLAISHAQFGEQRDQARVGAFVEDEEAGVDAVRDVAVGAGQRDVDGVGVAAQAASASKTVTSQCGARRWAAPSPAMPEPTTAMRGRLIGRPRGARADAEE